MPKTVRRLFAVYWRPPYLNNESEVSDGGRTLHHHHDMHASRWRQSWILRFWCSILHSKWPSYQSIFTSSLLLLVASYMSISSSSNKWPAAVEGVGASISLFRNEHILITLMKKPNQGNILNRAKSFKVPFGVWKMLLVVVLRSWGACFLSLLPNISSSSSFAAISHPASSHHTHQNMLTAGRQ